jgi:hypothetical protein
MSHSDFDKSIHFVGRKIMRKDAIFGNTIPVKVALIVMLRYSADGDSYST